MDDQSDPDTFVSAEQFANSQASHTSEYYDDDDSQLPVPIINNQTANLHNSSYSMQQALPGASRQQLHSSNSQPLDTSSFMWTLCDNDNDQQQVNDADLTDVLTQDNISVASNGDVCGTFFSQEDNDQDSNHQQPSLPPVINTEMVLPTSINRSRLSAPGHSYANRRTSVSHTSNRNSAVFPAVNPVSHSSAISSTSNPNDPQDHNNQQELDEYDASNAFDPSITDGNFTLTIPPQNPSELPLPHFERSEVPKSEEKASLTIDDDEVFQKAAHGLSSFELDNPFYNSSNLEIYPEIIRVYSTGFPVPQEEIAALHDIASGKRHHVNILRRLFETLAFHNIQLENCKNVEAALAKKQLEEEQRRSSNLNNMNSTLIDSLVSQLEQERERNNTLGRVNADLTKSLDSADEKISAVEQYYSSFDQNFSLSDDVHSSLEKVHNGLQQYRLDLVEERGILKDRVKEANHEVTKLEDVVSKSKDQINALRQENQELKLEIRSVNIDDRVIQSPNLKNSGYAETIALECRVKELEDITREKKDEVSSLKDSLRVATEKKRKADDTCLYINIENTNLRKEREALRTFKQNAEKRCEDLEKRVQEDRSKHQRLEKNMKDTIVAHSEEVESKKLQIKLLTSQIHDREEALSHLKDTNVQLESEIEKLSDVVIQKAKNLRETVDSPDIESVSVFKSTIDTYRRDVAKSHNLLKKRTEEVESLKRTTIELEEQLISLERECNRLKCSMTLRENTGIMQSNNNENNNNQAFLRRLSLTLNKHTTGDAELVKSLSERVQKLGEDIEGLESENCELHDEADSRERSLHALRSEMQAEISTLKAEIAQLRNRAERAENERKEVEAKYVEMLESINNGDLDSTGDLTCGSLSFSHRRSNVGAESASSRRASIRSSVAGDDTNYWNDPFIVAAIESVQQLISAKDGIAVRYETLRDKITNLLNEMRSQDISSHSSRSLIIESKDLLEELLNMLGMQGSIIDKLRSGHFGTIAGDDTLPLIAELGQRSSLKGSMRLNSTDGDNSVRLFQTPGPYQHMEAHDTHSKVSPAADFLTNQLEETRSLYKQKLEVIAELSGLVRGLEQDVSQVRTERDRIHAVVGQLQEDYNGFLDRLSSITGVEPAPLAIEVAVERLLQNSVASTIPDTAIRQVATLKDKLCNLGAQKRILCHLINIYRSQYRLDIFAKRPDESKNPLHKFRAIVHAMVAAMRLNSLGLSATHTETPVIDISHKYAVPPTLRLTISYTGNCPPIMDAVAAINAVPRLEKHIQQREKDYTQLQKSLAALQSSKVSEPRNRPVHETDNYSSFSYDQDILDRKNELSRRFNKAMKDKEELEIRLSTERKGRHSAEAKVCRYAEKVSNLRKKVNKLEGNANAKEMAYKAAIRYVKGKADEALDSTPNSDENTDPSIDMRVLKENRVNENTNYGNVQENCRNQLFLQYEKAMVNLQNAGPDHPAYEEMKRYTIGLERVIERIDAKGSRRSVTRNIEGTTPKACLG